MTAEHGAGSLEASQRGADDSRRVVSTTEALVGTNSGASGTDALRAGSHLPQVIELFVFDAHTNAPLGAAKARMLTVAALPAAQDLTVFEDRWLVGPSPRGAPGPHIPELAVVAEGGSPLRLRPVNQSMIWVTAPGYGWSNVYLNGAWPGEVHVLLEATASLDVIVSSRNGHTTALVDLDVYPHTGDGAPVRVRRRVEDEVARFTGLPAGRFEALAIARDAKRPDFDQAAFGEGWLVVGQSATLRLHAAPIYGELAITLATPANAVAPQRVQSIEIYEQSMLVLGKTHHPTKITRFDESVENGRTVFRLNEPLRVAAAPFELLVRPHGIRIHGSVTSEALTSIEYELPELVQRRITVWDTTTNAHFAGRLDFSFEGAAPEMFGLRGEVSIAAAPPPTGDLLMLLPSVPFQFYLTPDMEWLRPELRHWPDGSAVPDELRIEVRTDPDREERRTVLENRPLQSGRFGR